MPQHSGYAVPQALILGQQFNDRVPQQDQRRQRAEVEQILARLNCQPGVVLADEVGMGKTFVALAVVYCVAAASRRGPVIIMVPPNLIDKWEQDLKTFSELYLEGVRPLDRDATSPQELRARHVLRYGVARHSVELLKLLDDKPSVGCHLIFLGQGAMSRAQSDKWVRLALIREALRRHGRGRASRLIKVKRVIHRFLAELLHALGEESANSWGQDLWTKLLKSDPMTWRETYNDAVRREYYRLTDDPVPEAVVATLNRGRIDLKPLAEKLEAMPLRSMSEESDRQRINAARLALKSVEQEIWKELLSQARWRSPLLVMDEAHHLKNPATRLARQFRSESEQDLRTGDGALAKAFDRMLFLTATPFQLGHQELVRVLERFGDVKWDKKSLGTIDSFHEDLKALNQSLTESQRSAILLQRCWNRLHPEEAAGETDVDAWWKSLNELPAAQRTFRQQALLEAYQSARKHRAEAQTRLRPWVIRHNKGKHWPDHPQIDRRQRHDGAGILDDRSKLSGLEVPPLQLLPFFLAARSAAAPGKDLLGEALCSSYEAFRDTRRHRRAERDEHPDEDNRLDLTHSAWYLSEFDRMLARSSGPVHPKISATVRRAVELWEAGEKVLIFAFYRQTCRALRIHISDEIERRILTLARRRFAGAGRALSDEEMQAALTSIQERYMDRPQASERRALDRALHSIVERCQEALDRAEINLEVREQFVDIMRRFLRVRTTLVRSFPIHQYDTREPHLAVRSMLDKEDGSGLSWRAKFAGALDFLIDRCSRAEREAYLEAASRIQTGKLRVAVDEHGEDTEDSAVVSGTRNTLANVQIATGQTKREHRSRRMRAFNTPFFPDIFICSEVMGEGVDLQRYCRYVIHHDLAWNPSQIEQRTGRIDRLGCKAENRQPIHLYLPYLAGAADERQYRVMDEREQWFRVVMGQDEVAKLIPDEPELARPRLPTALSERLSFDLAMLPTDT